MFEKRKNILIGVSAALLICGAVLAASATSVFADGAPATNASASEAAAPTGGHVLTQAELQNMQLRIHIIAQAIPVIQKIDQEKKSAINDVINSLKNITSEAHTLAVNESSMTQAQVEAKIQELQAKISNLTTVVRTLLKVRSDEAAVLNVIASDLLSLKARLVASIR